MPQLLALLLSLVLPLTRDTGTPQFPQPAPDQFTVRTVESGADGKAVLVQYIALDAAARRSHMVAQGELVNGFLEQTVRCDDNTNGKMGNVSHPGYFLTLNAVNESAPASACSNMSLPFPSNFDFGHFWTLPPSNASFQGTRTIADPTGAWVCVDSWAYTNADGSFVDSYECLDNRKLRLHSSVEPHKFRIAFYEHNFGAPPLSAFDLVASRATQTACSPAVESAGAEVSPLGLLRGILLSQDIKLNSL